LYGKAPRAKTPEPARESFEEQNAWMDEYRARVADEKSKSKSKSKSSTPAVTAAESKKKDDDASTGADAGAGADADPLVSVSAAEMEAARRAVDSTRIRAQSAPRARTRAHKHCAAYLGEGPHGDGLPRPKELIDRAITKPKPFSFEAREKTKTKTISEQRLEQDLAIAAELERITINKPFKATSIPRSTVEPRYQRMIERETMKREERRESRKAALVESEKPFSFYLRDKEAKRYTLETAAERTARRANKFQRRFKAKEIPAAVKALKLGDIEARDARRKEAAKAAAVAKLAQSRLPERMALHANEGGGGHGASSDASTKPSKPKWSFKPAPAKEVPDIDAVHEKFFRRLQSARGDFVATVPREFRLREHTKEEKEAIRRKLKSDIAADEENLPENRWPFASLRAKVHPSPPPAFSSPGENFYKKNENLATKLRRQAMLKQRQAGHYATRAEKEAREDAARERDAKRRAAAWAHSQVANAGAKALDADGGTKGPGGKLAGARANAKGPADQHRAARHAQQATLARETVEKVLLENDVYTYVEEGEDGPF
jgi:protein FAM161A